MLSLVFSATDSIGCRRNLRSIQVARIPADHMVTNRPSGFVKVSTDEGLLNGRRGLF